MKFTDVVDQVMRGRDPRAIVEDASGPLGPDRVDAVRSEVDWGQHFMELAQRVLGSVPYVGPDFVTSIADQVRASSGNPDAMQELADLAAKNRDQYAGTGAIDAGGSYPMWDAIYQALNACRTDQVPPC